MNSDKIFKAQFFNQSIVRAYIQVFAVIHSDDKDDDIDANNFVLVAL